MRMAWRSVPKSAYVAEYNAKFSDVVRDIILKNSADGDAIAISVLRRYKLLEPELIVHLMKTRFRQCHLGRASGGKREFIVP